MPENLQELKEKTRRALDITRHSLVIKFPFIGEISLKMDLVPVVDSKNPTVTTDGKSIYVDVNFFNSLDKQQRSFVLAHEIWHCVLMHQARKESRDQKLFDLACDMETNYLLWLNNADGFLRPPSDVPMPPTKELEGKSAEQIYNWLLQNCQKQPQDTQDNKDQKKESSKENDQQEQSSFGSPQRDDGKYKCKNKDVQDALNEDTQKSQQLKGQFDKHRYIDSDDQEDDDNDSNSDVDFKPSIQKDFTEQLREAVIAQLQKTSFNCGSLPLGIESLVKNVEKPEIPWQVVLAQFMTQVKAGKLEWTPPSRRHIYHDLYLQSHRSKKVKIALVLDTSGSTINVMSKFLIEMANLLKTFDVYELHRIDCDADIQHYVVYDSESNPFTEDVSKGITYSGLGGTSFKAPFKFIREKNIDVDALVYFTDSFGEAPTNAPGYPVLWIVPADYNKDFCAWGKKLVFKDTKTIDW